MRMIATFLKLLAARFHGRALDLEVGRTRLWLHPDGTLLPGIAGADGSTDPEPDPEVPDEENPTVDPEPEPDEDSEPENEPEPDEFDRDRAMRTIKRQRAEEKRLKAERDRIKAERDEMLRERETEQERTVRELGEAKQEAERERLAARTATINIALRDAALEADLDPKRLKRALKLVDRSEIEVGGDGEVDGAEDAITAFLAEFPEFKAKQAVPDEDSEDAPAPRRTPGANPDRKRSKGGELTEREAARLARDDPDKFAEMLAEGNVPREALGGKTLDRLRAEGKTDAYSVANEDGRDAN